MEQQNPNHRLRRDLEGAGLAHADRSTAVERLADELGPDLLAVVLRCLEADAPDQRRDAA
jgi:hypothetical protein